MITTSLTGRVLRNIEGQDVNQPIAIEFQYDPEHDPLAVQMVVSADGEQIVWTFGRELFALGSRSVVKYGEGDVGFRYHRASKQVLMCLKSPEGHADLGLPAREVHGFVSRMADCEVDEDSLGCGLDEFLKEVLGQ